MIEFSITRDKNLIHSIVTDKDIWKRVTDDSVTNPNLFFVSLEPRFVWVLVRDDDEIMGLFLAEKRNHIMYEIHTMLLRSAYGNALHIAKEGLKWAFNNLLNCKRIITLVPSYNILADRLCRNTGLQFIGLNRGSYLYNGVMYDTKLYGISKEELCQ